MEIDVIKMLGSGEEFRKFVFVIRKRQIEIHDHLEWVDDSDVAAPLIREAKMLSGLLRPFYDQPGFYMSDVVASVDAEIDPVGYTA